MMKLLKVVFMIMSFKRYIRKILSLFFQVKMSFYLTLPSDSSLDIYPNNTLTNYTTKLKIPIRLTVPYEVSLVEISFKQGWTVSLGEIVYYYLDTETNIWKESVEISYNHEDGSTLSNICDKINDDLAVAGEELRKYSKEDVYRYPRIVNDYPYLRFSLSSGYYIKFTGILADIFGITNELTWFHKDSKIDISHLDPRIFYINSLYVYTDIINYQYVGDTLAPLLRTVHVPETFHASNTIVYDSPHYVPLSSSSIDSINIQIKDQMGNDIHFNKGKLILKLHFRPIRYGF